MIVKVVTKKEFDANQKFFLDNLGYVFNEESKKMCDGIFNGFEQCFKNQKDLILIMMCDSKKIYSLVTFEKYENFWLIDSMTTRREFQRQGLATKVLKAGMKHIKGDFCLHVDKDNLTAFNLYKKFGFEIDDKHHYQIDGSYFMTKLQKPLEK